MGGWENLKNLMFFVVLKLSHTRHCWSRSYNLQFQLSRFWGCQFLMVKLKLMGRSYRVFYAFVYGFIYSLFKKCLTFWTVFFNYLLCIERHKKCLHFHIEVLCNYVRVCLISDNSCPTIPRAPFLLQCFIAMLPTTGSWSHQPSHLIVEFWDSKKHHRIRARNLEVHLFLFRQKNPGRKSYGWSEIRP